MKLWMWQDEIEALKAANEKRPRQKPDHPITKYAISKTILNRVYQDWLDMFTYIADLEAENARLRSKLDGARKALDSL